MHDLLYKYIQSFINDLKLIALCKTNDFQRFERKQTYNNKREQYKCLTSVLINSQFAFPHVYTVLKTSTGGHFILLMVMQSLEIIIGNRNVRKRRFLTLKAVKRLQVKMRKFPCLRRINLAINGKVTVKMNKR